MVSLLGGSGGSGRRRARGFDALLVVHLWFLLAGRESWRATFPSAIATALFWLGMEVVFSFFFSSTVISDDKKYGPMASSLH